MLSHSTPLMPSPPMSYFVPPNNHFIDASDSTCSSPDPHACPRTTACLCLTNFYATPQHFPETMPSPALSAVSHVSSSLLVRSVYEQKLHDEQLRLSLKLGNLPLDLTALPSRFPRARARKNGEPVRYPIIHLISLAIRGSPRQALTLSQIYETVGKHLVSYRPVPGETVRDRAKRIQWQSSVRHSLSLQFMFVQVDRLPDDVDEKLRGNYWTLDPFKFGLSRRSVILETQKKAMATLTQQRKRASSLRKTTPAKPRSKARKLLSPAPQQPPHQPLASYNGRTAQSYPQRCEAYKSTYYTGLPDPSMAHPRDLHDLPPMNLPKIHPVMTSMSLHSLQVLDFVVQPYSQHPRYSHNHGQQPYDYNSYNLSPLSMPMPLDRGYEPEQGISPSLLHAPIPAQAPQASAEPVAVPSHGRSLRSTVSRQRRDALIPY